MSDRPTIAIVLERLWEDNAPPASTKPDFDTILSDYELNVSGDSFDTSGLADDPHGNSQHSSTFAVDGDRQPPEDHGNSAHTSTFAVDGDAQPPENHDNAAHSAAFVADGDGTERRIWVIPNGASDPAGANAEDIIFEEQA